MIDGCRRETVFNTSSLPNSQHDRWLPERGSLTSSLFNSQHKRWLPERDSLTSSLSNSQHERWLPERDSLTCRRKMMNSQRKLSMKKRKAALLRSARRSVFILFSNDVSLLNGCRYFSISFCQNWVCKIPKLFFYFSDPFYIVKSMFEYLLNQTLVNII